MRSVLQRVILVMNFLSKVSFYELEDDYIAKGLL